MALCCVDRHLFRIVSLNRLGSFAVFSHKFQPIIRKMATQSYITENLDFVLRNMETAAQKRQGSVRVLVNLITLKCFKKTIYAGHRIQDSTAGSCK